MTLVITVVNFCKIGRNYLRARKVSPAVGGCLAAAAAAACYNCKVN